MNVHTLWISSIALCLVACGQQEPAVPPEQDPPPVAESAPPAPAVDEAFVAHMHAHAEQLDTLMFALADGDLEGAMTPAYWLSRHDSVSGVPAELQRYIVGMREAASAVESAEDLDTARAAAEQISGQCMGCHDAAGINLPQ